MNGKWIWNEIEVPFSGNPHDHSCTWLSSRVNVPYQMDFLSRWTSLLVARGTILLLETITKVLTSLKRDVVGYAELPFESSATRLLVCLLTVLPDANSMCTLDADHSP